MDGFLDQGFGYYALLVGALVTTGLVGGFVAGMFGIGGGFVIVPALTVLLGAFSAGSPDHIMHVAIGTSLTSIFFTSLRSTQAHAKRGLVDWGILKSWLVWVAMGVVIGVTATSYMDASQLKAVFGLCVAPIGLHFLFPVLASKAPKEEKLPTGALRAGLGTGLGVLSSFLGIGGGTPAVLIMTLSGVNMHKAVATAAGFGTIIAVPGAIGSMIAGWGEEGLPVGSVGYVNLIALAAITPMTVLLAPLGARMAHSLDPVKLRRIFGAYLLVTAAFMVKDIAPWGALGLR